MRARFPKPPHSRRPSKRLLDRHRDELAGVIIEPLIQGAGGMKFHSPQALAHDSPGLHS